MAVTALSPQVWARHRTDAPQSHINHVVRCPSAVNRWTPHTGTQRHLTCPLEDTGHSPQSGIGAGKPEPPQGLHSEHKCPFCPRVLVPTTTAQQGLVTWWVQGFLRPSGGQWALPPQQLVSTPHPPASGETFLGSEVLTAAAPHGDPCPAARPRPCLFVLGRQRHSCLLFTPCPGGMWMPGLTASPGTGRRSTQPSLGTAAPGATSVSHLSWGWGGKADGGSHQRVTFRAGGHGPKADSPAPPGRAGCPQVSPP